MTRISQALVVLCCCLLVAGRLAAASKSFGGGGGYGGLEGGAEAQQQVDGAGAGAAENAGDQAAPSSEADATLTPTTPEAAASSEPTTPEPATPEAAASSEPATPAEPEAQPSTPATDQSGYSGGAGASEEAQPSTPATPAESGEASSASPATDQSAGYSGGGGGAGASADASGEPLNGLNMKAIQDIMDEHNKFRAKENVPPIIWNTTLAQFSQSYAETLKKDCKMVHSDSPYGENLMLGSGAISWKNTVDMWSDEKKNYHYKDNSCDPGKMCGHYTAVVWKDTKSVGCGRVLCDNKDTMIVCSYWPPGNYVGEKPY